MSKLIFKTERLILREFNLNDTEFILTLLNTKGFLEFIGDKNVRTLEDAEMYLEEGPMKSYKENGFGLWLVVLKDSMTPIGMCGFVKREWLDDIDIGFAFLSEYSGKGYAYEVASATMDYGKNTLGLNTVVAITDPSNNASKKLLTKLDLHFVKEIEESEYGISLLFSNNQYLFESERLGFRTWHGSDIANMAEINADPTVMEFFPSTQTLEQTQEFIERMRKNYNKSGYCYFAVDKLENGKFIGFIGLSNQDFKSDFTPCVDIGWRLKQSEWGKGYATEGAKRCLNFAFNELKLNIIKSHAPVLNLKSKQVMKKLGMNKVQTFNHPLLAGDERLQECVLYEIKASQS
ncbi:MAG: GNAT family N-acetyltransferase [Cytophagales bacterium]|nr:GNAT family N-acetyltransferase [Cytophagales bacterium]